MFDLTEVETRIIEHLEERGGETRSLFRLCVDLGIDYHNTHRRVSILEMLGLLIVHRSRGKPMIIQLTAPIVTAADAADTDVSGSLVVLFDHQTNSPTR